MPQVIDRPGLTGQTPQPSRIATQAALDHADWVGRYDFVHLGEFRGCIPARLTNGSICVGFFFDQAAATWFATSVHPWVVAIGSDPQEAINAWLKDLMALRISARSISRPAAAATEADIEAIVEAFGSL